MLIAAISGRALAQSARRSGYVPLVADFFADLDTREAAEEVVKVEGTFGEGFKCEPLMKALKQLAKDRQPIGVVSGAGFEQSGDFLDELAKHWLLLGNSSNSISLLKDPITFAELCAMLDIPHPETRLDLPSSSEWLVKQAGASGGSHIVLYPNHNQPTTFFTPHSPSFPRKRESNASMQKDVRVSITQAVGLLDSRSRGNDGIEKGEDGARRYFQRKVSGESISALFLADGQNFQIVGFSRQWASPTPDEPFRYGGAVHPTNLSEGLKSELTDDIAQIVSAIPLKGLNGADFIVDGNQHWLLEINPRPGATIDIFPGQLFKAHVDACQGKLPEQAFAFAGAHAAAIVYAERDIPSVAAIDWPDWAMDRQEPGTSVAAGEPLCTVKAEAGSVDGAMKHLRQREVSIRQQLEGNPA